MYIHTTDYKFKHIYNMDTLKDYNDYCERDIKRLKGFIDEVRAYQMELYNHVQHVLQTPIKHVVRLQRSREYSTNKVHFYVVVEERPQIAHENVEGNHVYGKYKDDKNFKGTERHLAIKYAEELAKKYHCEIERRGF